MSVGKTDECFHCCHKRSVRGRSLVKCTKPDEEMRGERAWVSQGRFDYPRAFDPIWKKTFCRNFQETKKDDD